MKRVLSNGSEKKFTSKVVIKKKPSRIASTYSEENSKKVFLLFLKSKQ